MAFKFSPKVVTDGLIMYCDVSNSKSFVSGTSLNDLSVSQINGTLTGGTSYTTNNINRIGSIRFNGVDGAVTYGNPNNLYDLNFGSIAVFFKIDVQVSAPNFKALICKQKRYGLFVFNNVLQTFDWGNAIARPTTYTITDSAWHYIVMTFSDMTGNPSNNANLYVDGNLVLTTTIKIETGTPIIVNAPPLHLGYGNAITQYVLGDVNIAQIYNRILTQQEIIQNYNTFKSRFGK